MIENTFAKGELIGLKVKIKKCKDPLWEGISGLVVDETKNTFLIRVNNSNKRISKKIATFEFDYDNNKITINGINISFRPEDRIKKIKVKNHV